MLFQKQSSFCHQHCLPRCSPVHFSGRAQCQRPHPCCLVRQAAGNSAPIGVTKAMAGPLAHQHTQWTDEELLQAPLPQLMAQAAELRDSAHHHITFSPKVFIPLTRLCRDTCSYCTFALPPSPGRRAFMTLEEVLSIARLGAAQGCAEALFTLGDKPELRWPEAAQELRHMGFSSTLEYVEAAARAVLLETGLLPHINAGVMSQEWMSRLKAVSASQGLMLESSSPAVVGPGGAHEGCEDKEPATRLAGLEAAGRARVPFTTGLLIGIGESRAERLGDLRHLASINSCPQWGGHIQEVIIQPFRAKRGTDMSSWPEPPLSELLWTISAARLILGPHISIQAPPNLTSEPDDSAPSSSSSQEGAGREAGWRSLIDAGINDFGGISPLTRDYVNPEKPWPHIGALAEATAAAGFTLVPRLPVYPPYMGLRGGTSTPGVSHQEGWLSTEGGAQSVSAAVLRAADSSGWARGSTWYAGALEPPSASAADEGAVAQKEDAHTAVGSSHAMQATTSTMGTSSGALHTAASTSPVSTSLPPSLGSPTSPAPKSAVPAVRATGRSWRVCVGPDGGLLSAQQPLKPRRRVQLILDKIVRHAESLGTRAAGQQSGPWAPGPQDPATRNPLTEEEVAVLLNARGTDFHAVVAVADMLRAKACGDEVSYVVNRNINYTNVCTLSCSFCAFSKGKVAESLRGPAYSVLLEEVSRRAAEAWDRGATEVCMQGGIAPGFTGETYLHLLRAAKEGAPHIHVHAFSPLEVTHGAQTLGLSLPAYLEKLRDAGLGSLPGTAAEVLDNDVRGVLCPDKISTQQWLEVVEAAHRVGLRTTSTLMFGHLESGPQSWARHLVQLRRVQERTGGITEFVPLPFVHMEAPVYLKGAARRGPTLHECILLHAVARLALYGSINNIQASWVKMGPERATQLLQSGCNDMGGSLMNESITRAAGASHGQELPPRAMVELITAAGRQPRQRTTLYGTPPAAQSQKSLSELGAGPLQPLVFAKP